MRRPWLLAAFAVLLSCSFAVAVKLATASGALPAGSEPWAWAFVALVVVGTGGVQTLSLRRPWWGEVFRAYEDLGRVADELADAVAVRLRAESPPSSWPVGWRAEEFARGTGADDLTTFHRARPRARLAIVGGPGAGKTTMARQLAVRLLEERTSGAPVPVPFALASWDTSQRLVLWLADELARLYPSLRTEDAHGLVQSGRILPVLDGFDELAPGRRAVAADLIERYGWPFVLTSRTDEFLASAVHLTTNVVELQPLSPTDLRPHLVGVVPDDVLDVLVRDPGGPLARVLTRPVMVELVARAYATPQTAVTELLDPVRFATPEAIERHLVETALLRVGHGAPARRWLGFLATHLTRLGATDFAWWQLHRAAPRPLFPVVAVLGGLLAGLACGSAFRGIGAPWVDVAVGGVVGLATAGALLLGDVPDTPVATSVRLGRRTSRVALLVGAAGGLAAAVLVDGGAVVTALGWCATGLCVGALVALRAAVTAPAGVEVVSGPPDSLVRDRRMALVQGAVGAITMGLPGGLAAGALPAVALGGAGGVVGLAFSAYYRYSVSRVWLLSRKLLPASPMRFLEHERRLGLLRRSGSGYRFSDRRVMDHLAAEHNTVDRGDPNAVAMVVELSDDLVERAFVRADVRAVVEAPRIRALKREIVAEVEDSAAEVVGATAAARERFVAARERLLARAGVTPPARLARLYWYAAVLCVGVLAAALAAVSGSWAWNALRGAELVLLFLPGIAFGLVPVAVALRTAWDRGREDESEQGDGAPVESRHVRLRAVVDAVASFPRARVAEALPVVGLLIPVFELADLLRPRLGAVHPELPVTAAALAGCFAVLWLWARPRRARWVALHSDSPESWPLEQDLPRRAARARRDAVRAHAELVDALVEKGVLPRVAARVEVLAKRSYDTALPEASVAKLGDLTESTQFVPTETSARLNRMLDAMSSGAIGLSGARGIGKSTVLGMFGEQRYGGNPDDLTVVVSAPTNYHSRDFLVHLFARVCARVLPAGSRTGVTARRRWVRLAVTALVGALLVAGAALWPSVVEAGKWTWRNVRVVAVGVGAALLLGVAVELLVHRARRSPRDTSVEDVARHHLRNLRYLETTTRTSTGAVKPPVGVELGGSWSRQRAEQVKTFPELVGDFRDFLAFLTARLPSRPDRRPARIVVCIDEVDKIATAEAAEQFVNDIKTIFGVPGCFFLVAVSEDALASFSRRALTVRTTFDSAFENVIRVSRLSLAQTRRLLVQRVLRLPEPFVWLCHVLSGGLPRDLNRTVRQLYDIRADLGTDQLDRLAGELVRQDLETVTHGQVLEVHGRAEPGGVRLVRWLAETTRLPLDPDVLLQHGDAAPQPDPGDSVELWLVSTRFQAYLHYAAEVLRWFRDRPAELVARLSAVRDDENPVRHLADSRAHLSVDSATADAAVDAYKAALPQ